MHNTCKAYVNKCLYLICATYFTIQGESHGMFTSRVNCYFLDYILTKGSDLPWHWYVVIVSETQTTIGALSTWIQLSEEENIMRFLIQVMLRILQIELQGYCPLGCDAVSFGKGTWTFWRDLKPPSWEKGKQTPVKCSYVSTRLQGLQVEVPMTTNNIPISNCIHATDPVY
jgi:hypothetical protein